MLAAALAVTGVACAAGEQTGFPFQDETLRYNINWQSGLSLGEATLGARRTPTGWDFSVTVSAGVPGFHLADFYHADADATYCSQTLDRDLTHGDRQNREKTTFDQQGGSAHRATTFPEGGGESDFPIPSCARDALVYAYYAREELGQGRIPPAQHVWFGSDYSVRMEYTGAQALHEGGPQTDHLVVTVKGPKADFRFEIFYARDAARTPLAVRIPLPLGTFSLELVR